MFCKKHENKYMFWKDRSKIGENQKDTTAMYKSSISSRSSISFFNVVLIVDGTNLNYKVASWEIKNHAFIIHHKSVRYIIYSFTN